MKKILIYLLTILNLTFLHSNENSPDKESCQDLVVIHGFLSHPLFLNFMNRNFKKEGYNVINYKYSSRSDTIEEHAKDLIILLNKIASENPNKPIFFLTHSLGGLVLRQALTLGECPDEAKIGKITMLAPPNNGVSIARKLGNFKIGRKILGDFSGKELMENINFLHLGEMPSEAKVLVIAGNVSFNPFLLKSDGIIQIEETYLKTPHEHVIIKATHKSIMFSKQAFTLAKHFFCTQDSNQ